MGHGDESVGQIFTARRGTFLVQVSIYSAHIHTTISDARSRYFGLYASESTYFLVLALRRSRAYGVKKSVGESTDHEEL
jgi:hypothetical protein